MTSKACNRCKTEQPVENFHSDSRRKDGLNAECKKCRSDRAALRRQLDLEGTRAAARQAMSAYRARPGNREKGVAASREYRKKNADLVREYRLEHTRRPSEIRRQRNSYTMKKFGLTVDQYDELYASLHLKQDGCCAACKKVPASRLELDHCHSSGRLRALLCGNCNRSLGLLRECPETIRRLADYAESWC